MIGDIGAFLIALAFSAGLLAGLSYVRAWRLAPDDPTGALRRPWLNIARSGFYTMVFAVMFASAILMYLILTHQFQYHYVWSHSSTNLARPFLFAAFYSGQEGSFMLWTLLVCFIGVFVVGYAERHGYESESMSVYMLVAILLLMILVVDSPFETIYSVFADQNLPAGYVPEDGRGLNPQLENLWITIHPPMLFTGFAAMTVPFVFAVAGLMRREYQQWITVALPWTLFATMILGFGIMLGGWWAYETLGWGGYWAWDPVENSSLIPWLIAAALVHTMLVQLRTAGRVRYEGAEGDHKSMVVGGLARTNVILAVLAFVGILYSTFLTRSGVLDDTSVHSFVAPGAFVYTVLQVIMGVFLVVGIAAIAVRWKELKERRLLLGTMTRENWLGVGSSLLLASSFVVTIGTSWPILMPLFGRPKARIGIEFYDSTHIWLGVAILLVNALSVLLYWKREELSTLKRRALTIVPISSAATALTMVLGGVYDPFFVLLLFGSMLALVANGSEMIRLGRKNWRLVGGYVAHAGVALLVLGVIATGGYAETEHVQLVEGETTDVFGYDVSYIGAVEIEREKRDREKYEHRITFEKDGEVTEIRPVVFWSDFNEREQAFLEPGILYRPTRDIYVAPKSLETVGGDPTEILSKGESVPLPQDSTIRIRFERFDMSRAESEGMQGAVVEVLTPDTSMFVTAYRTMDGRYGMVDVAGTGVGIGFAELLADTEELARSRVRFRMALDRLPSGEAKRAITVDVSVKPFILLVWGGVIVMVLGFFLSILRRRRDLVAAARGRLAHPGEAPESRTLLDPEDVDASPGEDQPSDDTTS